MPRWFTLRLTAQQWNVPPWVAAGEDPTPETIALWERRERIIRSME